ncbi:MULTISPECIES: exopolysaccharide transport family protein [Alphaproteobacteria]|uniref:Chain-length determining protein n=2 Tax=Alphaproteobacteria TaxID=28211 RepID=A0A512HN43_9HYPH|nr:MULTISPECIES: exopolysaccharide transport family protein [Alphaproteobacteria]GEO86877.1 chain-length determining protein [Ciceribacter naphthalenivorans]GLR24021.1 chain-length determining protein [Ciceribacter naphthalenivorans]GLT06877.1 chain-length determining protein [Sphingomonas psychrolutea]
MGLHEFGNISVGSHAERKGAGEKEYLSFHDVFAFLRRNTLVIGAFTVAGIVLGGVYVLKTQPIYQATTRLVMDPEQGRVISQDVSSGTVIIETAEIASQVEIVKSEAIALDVIQRLDLVNDPEFADTSSLRTIVVGLLTSTVDMITGTTREDATTVSEEERLRHVMGYFLSRVTVQRVGQSYVLQIGYSSNDPQKAARTANALADAYIRNGMNERAEAAKRGATWLENRLAEIGAKARKAAITAEEFRNRNGITAVGSVSTLDQQQLSELSSQVLAAKAGTAAESAKLEILTKLILKDQATESDPEEVANNAQIQKLREDIRSARTRLEGLKSRYSDGNPAIAATQAEIDRLDAGIGAELRRIASVYRANVEVARTREKLVEEQFAAASRSGEDKNIARVELAEMESNANTYRRLYESILQQLSGTLQTLSFPSAQARVVSAATAPFGKSWPKTSIILPFSAMLGFAGGLMVAVLRNSLDRRTSSSGRLERELGIGSLGRIPVYRPEPRHNKGKPALPEPVQPLRSILDSPYSRFSEALRGVKSSLDAVMPASGSLVVGVTSVGSGEGKTTIATNLAQLYQNEGQSVLLIDADFISARLTRLAANTATELGLKPLELEEPDIPLISFPSMRRRDTAELPTPHSEMRRERDHAETPSGEASTIPVPLLTTNQTKQIAASHQRYGHLPALKEAIEKLRKQYKVVIVDMSGFENSADTRTICTYLDGVILVLGNSNKMTIERLADALALFGRSRLALLGVVANRSGVEDWFQSRFGGGGIG